MTSAPRHDDRTAMRSESSGTSKAVRRQGELKCHGRIGSAGITGALYVEPRAGKAYAIAVQPQFVGNDQWSADAEFICRAWNSHDDLVAALQHQGVHLDLIALVQNHLTEIPENWQPFLKRLSERAEQAVKAARAALSKAGEAP